MNPCSIMWARSRHAFQVYRPQAHSESDAFFVKAVLRSSTISFDLLQAAVQLPLQSFNAAIPPALKRRSSRVETPDIFS
jgi:hypothetical protein